MSPLASNDGRMIPGADWSMSLSSPTSLSQAKLLDHLGGMLRDIYSDLIEEDDSGAPRSDRQQAGGPAD